MKNGFMHVNEVPGIGVDVNEKEAREIPDRHQIEMAGQEE
jgi:L-alanine-DL-glutamate epimerase-like enolase superfamily enzyme